MTRFSPGNLILGFNCDDLDSLHKKVYEEYGYDYEDILALTNWTEEEDYRKSVFEWMKENLVPGNFEEKEIKALVVDHTVEALHHIVEMQEQTGFPRLVGRVVVGNLAKGMGGEV